MFGFSLKPLTEEERKALFSGCQHSRVMRHSENLSECLDCRKVFASPRVTHCACHA